MSTVLPTSLDQILPLITAKIISDGVFSDPSLCYISDDDNDIYYTPGEQYAVVVAGNGSPWETQEQGGGRIFTVIDQAIQVTVWTRYATELAGRSGSTLNDQAKGILRKVHQVITSLQEFFPTDGNGNVLCVEGMRLSGQDRFTRKKGSEEWSRRRQTFRLIYMLDLGGTINNPPVS